MFGKVLPPKGLVKTSRESFVKNRHVKKARGNELVKPSRESFVITYHERDTLYTNDSRDVLEARYHELFSRVCFHEWFHEAFHEAFGRQNFTKHFLIARWAPQK